MGLAAPDQIRKAEKYVRRFARDLPQFDSVWIDALAQARLLSPFQAAQLNAGRGESLRVGPYLLCQPLGDCPWIGCYRARHVESGEIVRLAVADATDKAAAELLPRLGALVAASDRLPTDHLLPIRNADHDAVRTWAASPWLDGRTAAAWLVHQGRFSPEMVLEIARAMTTGLAALEKHGLCHGDVAAQSLLLTADGRVLLLQPGLRAIFRPEEGYAHADLQPEAYDYLAPERITAGTPPDVAGDVYACGCVWWHLLCGRPPLAGGDALAKLRAGHAATIVDVRRLAPETPALLADAIAACVGREPNRRPRSMTQLVDSLGRPSQAARHVLARGLGRGERPHVSTAAAIMRPTQRASRTSQRLAVAALAAMAVVAAVWPLWQYWHRPVSEGDSRVFVGRKSGQSPGYSFPSPKTQPTKTERNKVGGAHSTGPPDLLLDANKPWEGDAMPLQPGQCVRGSLGRRPSVMVPPRGLVVAVDRVRFENIDFIWKHPPAAAAAIVQLRTAHGDFQGCTFQATATTTAMAPTTATAMPCAIAWTHPADAAAAGLTLPSGRLKLSDCVFRNVAAAIHCRTLGALSVDMTNVLHLGGGAVLRLDHCPRIDEPLTISISRVTLRGGGPLLQCDESRQDDRSSEAAAGQSPASEVSISAAGCVLAPAADQALLLFVGRNPSVSVLAGIKWTGEGSLVLPETPIAAWRRADGGQQVLDEAALSIAGLVRSEVKFAGRAEDGPAASRIVHWQAPLQSVDPPGVEVDALPHP